MMRNEVSANDYGYQALSADRRKTVRYACILEARSNGQNIPVGKGWVARITDISTSGNGLHFGQGLPTDADVTLGLYGKSYSLSPVQACIVRRVEQPGGTWFMGAAFVTPLEEEQLQRLLA